MYRVHGGELSASHSDLITKARMERAISRYTVAGAATGTHTPAAETAASAAIPKGDDSSDTNHDLDSKPMASPPPASTTRSALRQNRKFVISSLSLGSDSSSFCDCDYEPPSQNAKNKAPRAKTVSWGLAYVSEVGDEDAVSLALRDSPTSIFESESSDSDSDDSDDDDNDSAENGSSSHTHGSSAKRFDCHQCQTAPNRPPRRPSLSLEEDITSDVVEAFLEDLEAGETPINVRGANIDPGPEGGPRQSVASHRVSLLAEAQAITGTRDSSLLAGVPESLSPQIEIPGHLRWSSSGTAPKMPLRRLSNSLGGEATKLTTAVEGAQPAGDPATTLMSASLASRR